LLGFDCCVEVDPRQIGCGTDGKDTMVGLGKDSGEGRREEGRVDLLGYAVRGAAAFTVGCLLYAHTGVVNANIRHIYMCYIAPNIAKVTC
jgi:hypothetical protein